MNIEIEIKNIKARLDHIEDFLSGASAQPTTQPDSGISYELVDLQVKKSQSIIGPEYAYRLKVKNSSAADARFTGRLIFLDSSEFEVYSELIASFTVPAGETFTKTGKATVIDQNHAPRIADVTAEIFPI